MKTYENEYGGRSGRSGRQKRDMDHNVSLKKRECKFGTRSRKKQSEFWIIKHSEIIRQNIDLVHCADGRKLQDVNCLLKKVGEEQKALSQTRLHLDNQSVIASNDKNVQVIHVL